MPNCKAFVSGEASRSNCRAVTYYNKPAESGQDFLIAPALLTENWKTHSRVSHGTCMLKLNFTCSRDEEAVISLCQRATRQNYSHVAAALF